MMIYIKEGDFVLMKEYYSKIYNKNNVCKFYYVSNIREDGVTLALKLNLFFVPYKYLKRDFYVGKCLLLEKYFITVDYCEAY